MHRTHAVLATAMTGLFSLSCAWLGGGDTMAQCYSLVEGDTKTLLAIEGQGDDATVTVYEWKDGTEVAPPQETPGRLEDGDFVYPDGTRLAIDGATLSWPEDSLLGGAVFTADDCP